MADVEHSAVGSILPYKSLRLVGADPGQTLKIGLSNTLSGGWGLLLLMRFVQCIAASEGWCAIGWDMCLAASSSLVSLLPD